MAPTAVVPLHLNPLSRVGDVVMGVVITLVTAAVFVFIGALFGAFVNENAAIVAWAIGGVLCLGALATGLRRAFKPGPSLQLYDDRLVIEHAEVFDPPAEITKANVAHVAVEHHSRRIRPLEAATAFPIGAIDDGIVPGREGFLYSSEEGNPIPLICAAGDVPNLAVLFHNAHRFSTTRPFKAAFMASDRHRLHLQFPNRIDDVMGFLTRVADPRQAEATFAEWGTGTGTIPEEHAQRVFPDPATYNWRLRRGGVIFGVVMVGAVIIRYIGERLSS